LATRSRPAVKNLGEKDKPESSPAARISSGGSTSGACEGLIEAAWLAAAVIVPLIFHQHAVDGFQPYKTATLHLLAAIIAAAWAIQTCLNRRVAGTDRPLPRSVPITLLAILGAQLMATIFSINPRASFSVEENSQGLVTALADAVLCMGVAVFLRRAVQVNRLISAITAASIPAAIYALVQRAGFDPIAFDGSEARVFSTLGHPIYLAAYLAMAMPLTWWKIAQEGLLCRAEVADPGRIWRLLFHVGVAVVQVAGFFCAQSRGPLIGLVATAAFFGLGWAVLAQGWRRLWQVAAVICAGVGFLVFLNLPLASSSFVAQTLGLERFATALGLKTGADPYRKAHWNAGVELMSSTKPILFPEGGGDRWHALRPWIGYGPETLANVLPQRYLWPGTDLKPENRFHNCVLDDWFAIGAIGTLAFLGFFVLLVRHGMADAGLGSRRVLFVFVPGLAIGVGGLFCALAGKGFLGLGIVIGIGAGCFVSLLMTARHRMAQPEVAESITVRRLLPIALLAALVGHLVETGFAFVVPATSLLFWLYAGMLLALSRVDESLSEPAGLRGAGPVKSGGKNRSTTGGIRSRTEWIEICLAAYAPTLVLATLVYNFTQLYTVDFIDWTTVLGRTLTQLKGDQGPSHLGWLLFAPTWLATVFACAGKATGDRRGRWWIPLTISAGIAGVFAIAQAAQIAAIGPLPQPSDPPTMAFSQIRGYQTSYFDYVILVLGILFGAAWMLRCPAKTSESAWRPLGENGLAIALGFAVTWIGAFHEVRADITGGWGRALVSLGRLEAGTEVLQQAVREMPYSIFYRRELGAALIRRARAAHDFESFDWLSRQAEAAFIPATEEIHGMSTSGADLARLYLPWAAFTTDPARRDWLAQQAAIYFDRQQRFAPGHPVSWLDSAVLDEFLHRPEEAERKLRVAIGLMDWRVGFWADAYRALSIGCSAPELRQAYATIVFRLFDTAIQRAHASEEIAIFRVGRAALNLHLGHIQEAQQECLEIRSALPAGEVWQVDAILAEIDRQSHDPVSAKKRIEKAIDSAPADKKATLMEEKRRIDAR